ncbi:hypothetical protein Q5P01_009370 [Channa striata]|uniref:Centromere protein U n=1 Tax=Channa striata TaxID=64152 RepID=A0AA88N5D4_CHASR|nr:hypothetical protein Q5P01_009370 [Channa striata]
MSGKKRRGAKVLALPQDGRQKAPPTDQSDLSNLSTIDKASFLEGLQINYGNPLHSTAMEEDLNVLQEACVGKEKGGRKGAPQTLKITGKPRGTAAKRKQTETGGEIEKEGEKRKRSGKPVNRENSAKTSSAGQKAAVRPVKNKQMKDEKNRKPKSGSGNSSSPQSQEESEPDAEQQKRRKVLSSEEEVDEDTSWNPSPKKAKVISLGKTRKSLSDRSTCRKSSSGSSSADPDNNAEQRKKRHGYQGKTDLEVVLDAFLDFCDQYRESVESTAVKQSVDSFSNNVKAQFLEKISSYKDFRVLKRENAKVGSLIRKKTQKLVDAKNELMRAERQVWLMQKEKAELKLRLADLRRGHAFLRDIRELNRKYLDYREKHPKEKEMYGTSSLPALIVETKYREFIELVKVLSRDRVTQKVCRNMAEFHDGDKHGGGDTVDALGIGFGKKSNPAPASGSKTAEKKESVPKSSVKATDSDPHRYKMDYPRLGTCLIINNKNFHRSTGMSTRNGTDVDADLAKKTFTDLGYDVRVFTDQTMKQMSKLLSDVSKEDHRQSASFVCVLLSHGDEGVIYGTDGPEKFENLTKYFKGHVCMSLVGKPKLFFIQACRGSQLDVGADIETDAVEEEKSERIPVEADFLYGYSTAPGYYSWRNTFSGSWFIQSFCEMLAMYKGKLDLMQIMTRVNHTVASKFESSSNLPGFSGKKQIPCIISMLTKDLYFPGQS